MNLSQKENSVSFEFEPKWQDETKAAEALFKNCKLAVDAEVEQNAVLMSAMLRELGEIFRSVKSKRYT